MKTSSITDKRGFTLIETMVAISILVIALTAPLTLASQSLFASVYSKDQIVASYLAQEGIEMVREKRDSNLLKIIGGNTGLSWIEGIPTTPFSVDAKTGLFINCGTTCKTKKINFDGAFYTYANGIPTRFTREIRASTFPGSNEIKITSTVYWQTGSLATQKVVITEDLFDWIPR